MKQLNTLIRLAILWVFILSCNSLYSSRSTNYNGFPLQQKWAIQTHDDIYAVVASNNWVAVATAFELIAIDPESGLVLWTKGFDTDVDSRLLLLGETLIATDSTGIKFLEKSGTEVGSIILDTERESAEVIAAIEHYVFVIRRPSWILEAYDTQNMALAWSISIERGGLDIYHSDIPGTVYMATVSGISAINLSDGKILWQLTENVVTSTYASNILYYIGYIDDEKSVYLAAQNVLESTKVWRKNISTQNSDEFLGLATLGESLIATSRDGLMAFNKGDGSQLWESEAHDQFPSTPVLLNNIIYIKGPLTRTVYAVSPHDGTTLGYLQFGASTVFSQSTNEYNSGIYVCKGKIVFFGTDTVYEYGE